jgi:predicted CXXCH cytochrome family protein
MKGLKLSLMVLTATLLALGVSGMAYAFHSGGVAECGGCHSMHAPTGNSFLLVNSDQSSTCLSCHEHQGDTGPSSYHVSTNSADMPAGTAPLQRTPGGDFGWLKKTYNFTVRGTPTTEEGQTHGHNIVALDHGYVADTTNTTAPGGGTFQASDLACTSCHDPHGKYRRLSTGVIQKDGAPIKASGSYTNATTNEPDATNAVGVYRLLAGDGYSKGGVTFTGVPAAKVPSSYNQSEASTQVRVAYGVATTNGHVKWGTWCSTCHPNNHSDGNYVHPVDTGMSSDKVISNYTKYVKSGDMNGTQATAFTSLVPFATNSGNYTDLATLATVSPTSAGPNSGDQVTCLSCHRAHASGFPFMLRWSMENEFMVVNGAYQTQQRGRATLESRAGYYDRLETPTFASYQRVLCNKCHAQD